MPGPLTKRIELPSFVSLDREDEVTSLISDRKENTDLYFQNINMTSFPLRVVPGGLRLFPSHKGVDDASSYPRTKTTHFFSSWRGMLLFVSRLYTWAVEYLFFTCLVKKGTSLSLVPFTRRIIIYLPKENSSSVVSCKYSCVSDLEDDSLLFISRR